LILDQIDDPVGDDHAVLDKHEEIWKEADEDLDDLEFDQSRGLLQALWRDEGSKDMVVIAGRQGDVITCHASVFAMASDFASDLMTQERNWEEADNVRVYVSLPEFSFVTVIKMMEKMYCLEGGDEDVIDESGELAALAELLQIQQVCRDPATASARKVSARKEALARSKEKKAIQERYKKSVTIQRNKDAFKESTWQGKQTDGKGLLRSAALSTAHAQFRIKSELAQLASRTADPDDPDEPLAKRVKRRNDRVKMEPDDDFLDPEYILSDNLKPGRGRGGRKFDFDEDLGYDDDATHGDLDWYKPNKVVDSPIHLPETKKPVKLGRPPTKRKRGRPRLGLGKPGSKKPACIANTEDAENEGDLANKGLDFLVKHAAEHKIPKKQREGKAADLASVIWKHYRLAHKDAKSEISDGIDKKVSRPCWKCGNSVDISEKYCKSKRREWGLMSGTALLTFFECRVCNAAMEGAASGLDVALPNTPSSSDQPSSCAACKLFYLGGFHICPPSTQTCNWQDCGQVFSSWTKMEYHTNKHRGVKPFSCDKCDFSTHSLTQLTIVHKGRGKCPNAPTIASVKRSKLDQCHRCPELNTGAHQADHHNPELQPFQCEECEYRAVSIEAIDIHKAKYHKELGYKTPKFQCSQCPQMLTRKTQKDHDKMHHSENLPFACDECNFRALLHGSILYHKGRWHREKKFECRLGCGEAYTTRSYRDSHERRWCPKSEQKEELRLKEIEDGTRARETERCKQLAAKTQDRYSRLATDDPSLLVAVKCGLCSYAALSTEEVQAHIDRTHPEEADIKKAIRRKRKLALGEGGGGGSGGEVQQYYQCPKCPIMIHRYMLKQHDEEHHNTELPFGCPNCEYRALSKMAIACHVTKYHKDHDKHICQLGCGKSFTSDFYMKYHMKRYCINSKEKEETIRMEDMSGVTAKKRAFKRDAKQRNMMRKVAYNNLRPEHIIQCRYGCGLRFAEMLYMERHANFNCSLRPPKLDVS